MSHIGTTDEVLAREGPPENAIQRMLEPERRKTHKAKNSNISTLKSAFLKLDIQLREFGKTKCKFHRNRKDKPMIRQPKGPGQEIECCYPVMSYNGMYRNTDCRLKNCPRIFHGVANGAKK